MDSMTEKLAKIIRDISVRREEIKEEYIKAWLAYKLPKDIDVKSQIDWILDNCQLEEKWSDDRKSVTWRMVIK
jgi:hypothetical protein